MSIESQNVVIRSVSEADLKEIVNVHVKCFPNSFSTYLGKGNNGKLLQKFYQEYLTGVPQLFLVVEDRTLSSQKIIGFCMGYFLDKNDYNKEFLKHNFFSIVMRMSGLLLSGNRFAWRKLTGIFKKKETAVVINNSFSFLKEEAGDLLSICVLPEYRGTGVAKQLIEIYCEKLRLYKKKNMFVERCS